MCTAVGRYTGGVRVVRFQNFPIISGVFGRKESRFGVGFGPFKTGIFK